MYVVRALGARLRDTGGQGRKLVFQEQEVDSAKVGSTGLATEETGII